MTVQRYLADASLTGEVKVVSVISSKEPIIRTDQTWFHPQGGGQKGDQGWIGNARIRDTRFSESGHIDHIADDAGSVKVGSVLPFTIDEEVRLTHARMHSAGHLIAGVVEENYPGLIPISGHHWPGEGRVEFREETHWAVDHRDIEALVRKAVEANLSVVIQGDPYTDRRCAIGHFRPIPCGGTHVTATAMLGDIEIKYIKSKKGKLRIGYSIHTGTV